MEGEEQMSTNSQRCSLELITDKVKKGFSTVFTWKVLKPILFGQILSVLLCGTAITSTYLEQDYNSHVPLTQSFFNYALLCLVYGTILLLRKDDQGNSQLIQVVKSHWLQYLLITVADVAGNYLIVKAYQYTSLTSVQVLDCFAIFVVMILSIWVLKVRYLVVHYVGVGTALLGVAVMIIADVLLGKGGSGSQPLVGDLMVLAAASCYGISNVGMEYAVKRRPLGHMEILSMFGIFGTTLTGVLIACFERTAIQEVKWESTTYMLFAGFALCMFLFYSLMPIAMKLSSATTVNLSILTTDLYALFAGLFLFGYQLSSLYFISFIVISLSLVIYNSKPPGTRDPENIAVSSLNDPEIGEDEGATPSSETRLIGKKQELVGTSFKKEESS